MNHQTFPPNSHSEEKHTASTANVTYSYPCSGSLQNLIRIWCCRQVYSKQEQVLVSEQIVTNQYGPKVKVHMNNYRYFYCASYLWSCWGWSLCGLEHPTMSPFSSPSQSVSEQCPSSHLDSWMKRKHLGVEPAGIIQNPYHPQESHITGGRRRLLNVANYVKYEWKGWVHLSKQFLPHNPSHLQSNFTVYFIIFKAFYLCLNWDAGNQKH